MGIVRRHTADQTVVITSVPISNDDEYEHRKKKYAVMMGIRAVCVLLAVIFCRIEFGVAIGFAIAGLVLPWCAVLIANDGPAKKKRVELGHVSQASERALPPGSDRIVDG